MYIVYVKHCCNIGAEKGDSYDLALLTDDKIAAVHKAHEIVDSYRSDKSAFIDSEWDGIFDDPSNSECIIFWDRQENWDWYNEVHISEVLVGVDYLPV